MVKEGLVYKMRDRQLKFEVKHIPNLLETIVHVQLYLFAVVLLHCYSSSIILLKSSTIMIIHMLTYVKP